LIKKKNINLAVFIFFLICWVRAGGGGKEAEKESAVIVMLPLASCSAALKLLKNITILNKKWKTKQQ